jgi:hypothetical protein
LYDPLTMPGPLLKAHQQLDRAVDRRSRPEPFPSDRHRVEYLFVLYEHHRPAGRCGCQEAEEGKNRGSAFHPLTGIGLPESSGRSTQGKANQSHHMAID